MSEHDRVFHQKKCRPHLKQVRGDKRAVFSFVQDGDRRLLYVGKPRKKNPAVETYATPLRVNRALATMGTDAIGKTAKIVAGEVTLTASGELQFEIVKMVKGATESQFKLGLKALRKDLGITKFQILNPDDADHARSVESTDEEEVKQPPAPAGKSVFAANHPFSDDHLKLLKGAFTALVRDVILPDIRASFDSWRQLYEDASPPIFEVVGSPSAGEFSRRANQIGDEVADLVVNGQPAAWSRILERDGTKDGLLRGLTQMYLTQKPHYETALHIEWQDEYRNTLATADAVLDQAVEHVQGLSSIVAQISPNVLKAAISGEPAARAELLHQIEHQIHTQVDALVNQPDSPTKDQLLKLAHDIGGHSDDVMIAVMAEAVAEEPDWDDSDQADAFFSRFADQDADEQARHVSELQIHLRLHDMAKDVVIDRCPSDKISAAIFSKEKMIEIEDKIDRRISMLDLPKALQPQDGQTGSERMETVAEEIADYVLYYLSAGWDLVDATKDAASQHSLWTKEKRSNPENLGNVKGDVWTGGSSAASGALLIRNLAVTMPAKAAALAQQGIAASEHTKAVAALAESAAAAASGAADAGAKATAAAEAAKTAAEASAAAQAAAAAAQTASIIGSGAAAGVSAILCVRTSRQAYLSKKRANAFQGGMKRAREEGQDELGNALEYAMKKVRRQQRAREVSATCNGISAAISIAALACTATGVGAPVGLALAIAGGVVAGVGFMATTGRGLFKWARKKSKANEEEKATGSLGNARRLNGRTLLIYALDGNTNAAQVLDQIHVMGKSKAAKYNAADGNRERDTTESWSFADEPTRVEEKWNPKMEPVESELKELTEHSKKLRPSRMSRMRRREPPPEYKEARKKEKAKKKEVEGLQAERAIEFRIANTKVRKGMKKAKILSYMTKKLRSSA